MSIINIFTSENNLTLKRVNGPATKTNGVYNVIARTSTSFTGSVQTAPEETLLTLTEAQRTRNPKVVFTKTELKTVDKKNGLGADYVEYEGQDYEVVAVAPLPDWNPVNMAHYEVTILRKDE